MNKCKQCNNIENYNYAIDNGLCNNCIAEKLEQLDTTKTNVDSLLKTIQTWKEWSKLISQELDNLKAENEKLRDRLRDARNELDTHAWSDKCHLKPKP